MNLLVTGGAGFLGSGFVRAALAGRLPGLEDAHLTVVDKLTYAGTFGSLSTNIDDPRLDFFPGDVADSALVEVLMRRADHVVHFAASTVDGTRVLLEAALRHDVAKVVVASTAEVYGPVTAGSRTEDTPLAPASPHAATKAGADLLALAYHRAHGLPATVVRATDAYGPFQHPEKLIPYVVTTLLRGLTAEVRDDDGRTRDWLHLDDHCAATALVLTGGRPGEVYHVGGATELSDEDLTARLHKACGAAGERAPHAVDRSRRYSLDDTKLRDELAYRPAVDFDEGLDATVDWYRANEDWWRSLVTTA
jgi:dTDP-glucose 4,6-dehydratase